THHGLCHFYGARPCLELRLLAGFEEAKLSPNLADKHFKRLYRGTNVRSKGARTDQVSRRRNGVFALSPSHDLVRVLGPVILAEPLFVTAGQMEFSERGAVGPQFVGHDQLPARRRAS